MLSLAVFAEEAMFAEVAVFGGCFCVGRCTHKAVPVHVVVVPAIVDASTIFPKPKYKGTPRSKDQTLRQPLHAWKTIAIFS